VAGGTEMTINLDLDPETESLIHKLIIGFQPKPKKGDRDSAISFNKTANTLKSTSAKINESSNEISNV